MSSNDDGTPHPQAPPGGPRDFSAERFSRFLDALERFEERTGEIPADLPSRGPPSIRYGNMPTLDCTKPAEVDRWFLAFEGKMSGASVAERHWVACFHSCDRVSQEVKSALPVPCETYSAIRAHVLRRHGPKDAVGFFLAKLHAVRGTGRESVQQELERILTLLNRACRDAGEAVFSSKRLVWPFLLAFPPKIRQDLERHLGSALKTAEPFDALYEFAPAEVTDEPLLAAVSEVTELVTPVAPPAGQEPEEYCQVAAVAPSNRLRGDARFPQQVAQRGQVSKRPGGSCSGCGGTCTTPQICPAYGKPCNACGKMNHFARVCRSRQPPPAPSRAMNPPRPFQSRPPFSRQS